MTFPAPIKKLKELWDDRLPFAFFAMPDSSKCTLTFQTDTTLHTTDSYIEPGFMFAPFNYTGESLYIPSVAENTLECDVASIEIDDVQFSINTNTLEKKEHQILVETVLNKINAHDVVKVVVSRKKTLELQCTDIAQIAIRLLQLYPQAFRYIWYHPDTGLWCGASPEILVKTDGQLFSTMALAGTKQMVGTKLPDWSYKEIHEQQVVTDVLVTNLQKVTAVIKTSKPVTVNAGSLYHLKTEITGVIKTSRSTLSKIIKAIHPTPAVCGAPSNKAKNIILEIENYDREFYTGFLGPVNLTEGNANLFVNLRCAKIEDNVASIYVGGGIVTGSEPEEEWEETENKLNTMTKVLAPFLKY